MPDKSSTGHNKLLPPEADRFKTDFKCAIDVFLTSVVGFEFVILIRLFSLNSIYFIITLSATRICHKMLFFS